MIQLESGTKDYVITPRDEYPHGSSSREFKMTLKSRATGEVKSAWANQALFSYGNRAVKVRFMINEFPEDLDLGYLDLKDPEFPAGYYSYIIYQADASQLNLQMIDLGVAYLRRDSDEDGFVQFDQPSESVTFNAHEL